MRRNMNIQHFIFRSKDLITTMVPFILGCFLVCFMLLLK
jgi:hypothetical protein